VAAVVVAAGGEADEEQLALLFTNLEGKDIHELLAKGEVDLKNCSSGGGGGGGAAAAPAGTLLLCYSILFLSNTLLRMNATFSCIKIRGLVIYITLISNESSIVLMTTVISYNVVSHIALL
jgi:60s Acidic ribosomal protein